MNKISLENCFTAGELASLFGISKQTLLYYDRIKLLCPDFISDNGYRHYSINQYLDLEIIVNLRSLNIPISDIKEYLEHRNKSEFIKQLEKKRAECQSIIKENERIMASIDFIEGNLAQHKNLPLGQITVSWREERLLRLTNVLSTDNGKKRISKFAHHSQIVFHNRGFINKQAGWIINQKDFFEDGNYNCSQAFFSFSEHQKGHYKTPRTPLPMGLYLELYKKTFMHLCNAMILLPAVTLMFSPSKTTGLMRILITILTSFFYRCSPLKLSRNCTLANNKKVRQSM